MVWEMYCTSEDGDSTGRIVRYVSECMGVRRKVVR